MYQWTMIRLLSVLRDTICQLVEYIDRSKDANSHLLTVILQYIISIQTENDIMNFIVGGEAP